MGTKDIVKSEALRKLKGYVECEIKRLHDGGLSLDFFEFKPTPDSFTEEEKSEISSITDSLKFPEGIISYCRLNNIEI